MIYFDCCYESPLRLQPLVWYTKYSTFTKTSVGPIPNRDLRLTFSFCIYIYVRYVYHSAMQRKYRCCNRMRENSKIAN